MKSLGYVSILMLCGACVWPVCAQNSGALKVDSQASQAAANEARTSVPSEARPLRESVSVTRSAQADGEKVVATWRGGQLNNDEVSATLAARAIPELGSVSPFELKQLPKSRREEVIRTIAWDRILLQQAREAGYSEKSPELAERLRLQEETLLNRLYFDKEVTPAIDKLVEKTARDYYDKHVDSHFTMPAQDVLRAIHVSTYELVTAEDGDTLESLAEEISGKSGAANRILYGQAPFYLRQTPDEFEKETLPNPLRGGEALLVPLDDDAVTSATKLAERIRTMLLDGKSVDEVAAATRSEDFIVSVTEPIRITAEAGYWDEIRSAAAGLKETSVSQVVKTPAGLNVLVLEDSISTRVLDYADVKDQLVERVQTDENQRRQTLEEARRDLLNRLWEKYNVQLNRDAVSRKTHLGSDPLTTDTAIVQVGDFVYTLEEFVSDLRLTGKDWGQLTEEQRLEVVKVAPAITNHLVALEARAVGLHHSDVFKETMQQAVDAELVNFYRRKTRNEELYRITDKELEAYYNDHIDNYTSQAQVTLREISKRINMTLEPSAKAEAIENAKASLTEIRSRINSEEDFAQLARRESEAISTRSRGGLIGTVADDFRGEAFKNQLRQLKPGEISEPFLYGSEVMIVRMDARTAPTAQAFEEVRRQVMVDFQRTEPIKLKNRERDMTLEKAGFELK